MTQRIPIHPGLSIPETEIRLQFTRSGGPGGQHVNKVSTRVELLFDVTNSATLDEDQKNRIMKGLASFIGADGILRVAAQESRSQWKNRENARAKFAGLLRRALARRKKRISTQPPGTAHERRISRKKLRGERKKMRRHVVGDE